MRDAAAWGSALGPLSGLSLCCLFSFLTLLAILSLLFIVLCHGGWASWASGRLYLGVARTDRQPPCLLGL